MLSDELDSKPELLVQFVQNASIPLVQGLEDSEPKQSCLPLLAPVESSLCSQLELTDGALSSEPENSSSLSELGGVSLDQSLPLVVQTHSTHPPASPSSPPILHDLQQSDGTSYVLLNLAKSITTSSDSLIFAADGAGDEEDEGVSPGDYGLDGGAPWYLRVQELAHDSLIAATRAQLARDAKASQDARAPNVAINGDNMHISPSEVERRETPPPRTGRPLSRQVLRCSFEGCCRTFTWPAHLKYHLKTHRNDRMFRCNAEGCGKSFYVLQRLQVHMRTHNGEKPFICKEKNCGKKFTTAGNLKNHRRVHTGEKPFLCEADGCGRSFAEYSSLRKHMLVHSGEKPHHCGICGKTFSQSGSRNVHIRRRHGEEVLAAESRETGEALTHSSLLEADGDNGAGMVAMTTGMQPVNLHHAMLRSPGPADSVVVVSAPHELVAMTTEGASYGDVVTLL
ncbi:zinc finger protein 410 isoform X1 [Nerophis ophidion]|uniref:zinc finger protein 410 isoform X1 n=1 Tax=Nerophis ophidion TaxID=159077 RepID=UPI002ADFBBA5|nr:zinc finger protein 410 isoform X1 [Nerophis ophidion]XP_061757060.1 zinc finger protein 410 isoform X1 [Nerophis ophidion]XP_061757061.1 zinc finger protein 410 isoform X1 [Nerophis ophidion]XP_061757062.1 zinc finger protein 410 isoform X1 [Nerophis ophidion]XP_061757063.1 zinc finger protein 410 isoform X1 [Nerophis ophidion]